jgi:hypothetical protein
MPRFRRCFFALPLVAAAYGLRAPWLGHDIWNLDEGSTFTIAQQVLTGDIPYRDAADSITIQFHRLLDPLNNPDNRGEQSARVNLPPNAQGKLVFHHDHWAE